MIILAEVTSELLEWSKDLMPWQRMILGRLLENERLSDADRSEIFKRAKIDHAFEKSDHVPPDIELDAASSILSESSGLPIRLTAIKSLQGANALRSGQELKFGEQLTVVYGENGSGKSGYARVLKKVCSARAVEDILPNVYSESEPETASCVFHCDRNGTAEAIAWKDGDPAAEDLKRFAVFDSNCGRAYVSSESQLQFAPAIFDVFEALASETDAMKQRFTQLADTLAPRPDSLNHLIDQTSIGDMLLELTHLADPDEIKRRARWSKKDDEVLAQKHAELLRLRTESPEQVRQALTAEKRRIELIRDHLKRVEDGIAESRIEEIRAKLEEHDLHDTAARTAAQLASGTSELEGIGELAWRELLQSAYRYSTQAAYPAQEFPYVGPDSRCVLCQQPLQEEAKQRLESFWAFLNSEASSKRAVAKRELDQLVAALNAIPSSAPPEILAIEDALLPQHRSLLAVAKHYFENAAKRIVAIRNAVAVGRFEPPPTLPMSSLAGFDATIEELSKEISSLEASDISKTIISVEGDVKELSARRRLSQNLPMVIGHVEALKQGFAALSIASQITTNSISIKAKDLQTKYLTEAYQQDVQDNIKSLGVRSAKAHLSGRSDHGRVLHRIKLDSAGVTVRPELVLSEGERTGLSLACFLAELGNAEETPGIILDDPVTSLDHRIREKVVKRLVEEAGRRQVIVFTHDLVFYCQLAAEAKLQQVSVWPQHIKSLVSVVGLISGSEPWDALPVDKRIEGLQGLLAQAEEAVERAEPEDYESKVTAFYARLRSTWERCVEELLFNKVIERFDKAVKSLRLTGVAVDTEGITSIHEGMTRASAIIEAHDHAIGENKALPGTDDLREDLEALKKFIETQRKKRKLAEKAHEHLKG